MFRPHGVETCSLMGSKHATTGSVTTTTSHGTPHIPKYNHTPLATGYNVSTLRHNASDSLNYTTAGTSHQHHDPDLIAQEAVLYYQPSITGTSHPGHPATISGTERPLQPTYIWRTSDHHPPRILGHPHCESSLSIHGRYSSFSVLFVAHPHIACMQTSITCAHDYTVFYLYFNNNFTYRIFINSAL